MAKKAYGYDRMIDVLENNRPSTMTGVPPRDSDKEMLIQILQFDGAGLTAEQLTTIRKFNFESLTRARRKLQNGGKYHGSPEVMRKRRIKGYELQRTAPTETAQGVHRRIRENE
ncbi:hypothetical protein KDA23_05430 [Candidatus Saccharibacteria bacterium]|nr:hypothetical protein [Candidatus Saccharibacteria bacterium]